MIQHKCKIKQLVHQVFLSNVCKFVVIGLLVISSFGRVGCYSHIHKFLPTSCS
jgi:hypothetical protein